MNSSRSLDRRRSDRLLWHAAAIGVATLFLLPLLWMAHASLQPVGLPPARTWSWFAHGVAWSNYLDIFRVIPLARQLGNSLLVSTVGAGLTLLTASWAGFAMAQMPPRVRRGLVGLALLLLLLPASAVWLPRYVLFARLGLIDTYAALVAPALMGTKSLFVLMFYWSFRRVATDLFESAWLDGAGVWTSWRRIALPLAAPTTLAVLVLAFSHYWSDFVDPLLFLKSAQRFTVTVGLRSLQQMETTQWPLLLAAVTVMMTPVLLLYLVLQLALRGEGDFVQRALRTGVGQADG
jgi:multiple sugar transport system permease protein